MLSDMHPVKGKKGFFTRKTVTNVKDCTYPLKKELLALMFRDNVQRRTRSYRLLSRDEIDHIWNTQRDLRCEQRRGSIHDMVFNKRQIFRNHWDDYNAVVNNTWDVVEQRIIGHLDIAFPFLKQLLLKYPEIIACGGAIHRAIYDRLWCDIDIFFINAHGCNYNEDGSFDAEAQNTLLFTIIDDLTQRWLHEDTSKWNEYEPSEIHKCVVVQRSEYVVTVYLCDQPHDLRYKYQFVLRVYPNVAAVLGGFDIPLGAMCYDGERVTGTEMGIWCNASKLFPVDTSRRSTSYEYRLTKYTRHCDLIFLSLDPAILDSEISSKVDHAIRERVLSILNKHDAAIVQGDIVNAKDRPPSSQQLMSKAELKIIEYAKDLGYHIYNDIRLHPMVPRDVNLKLASHVNKAVILQLISELRVEYDCALHVYGNDVVIDRKTVIKLPYIRLLNVTYDQNSSTAYRKCMKEPDLEVQHCGVPYVSDYCENRSSQYNGVTNTSLLRRGKFDSVVTFIIIGALARKRLDHINDDGYHEYTFEPNEFYTSHHVSARELLDVEPVINQENYNESVDTILHTGKIYNKRAMKNLFAENCEEIYAMGLTMKREQAIISAYIQSGSCNRLAKQVQTVYNSDIYRQFRRIVYDSRDNLNARMLQNHKIAKERLSNIVWITENPGRQWTSSINPIIEHPSMWYGEYYKPHVIGNRGIERTMWLMWKRPGTVFAWMPRDMFLMILVRVLMEDAADSIAAFAVAGALSLRADL
jgi:hypothetical protein